MDISSSKAASESGWTHYLDQSYLSEGHSPKEQDLSMVSDASSGPTPHYYGEDDQRFGVHWYPSTSQYTKETEKEKKNNKRVKEYGRIQQPSHLDDTASSHCLKYPKNFSENGVVENVLDYSHSLPATRIKRNPKFQNHFSFFKHSLHRKQASEDSDEEN